MFDPSKLNLDLDNLPEEKKGEISNKPEESQEVSNTQKVQKEELPKEESNTETIKTEEVKVEETNIEEETKEENPSEENNTETIKVEIPKEEAKEEIIFDINITNLTSLVSILLENSYDFLTIEPSESAIKIIFRKDSVEKEVRYIKYPIYNDILLKTKNLTKLKLDETHNKQEWSWELNIKDKTYKITSKIVPGDFWEKMFLKTSEIERKKETKKAEKTSIAKVFGFLWAAWIISLILWSAFITFIVLNAQTVEDVKFFYSLWINLNDINTFITKLINLIFVFLIFIESIFLIIFLFKLLLIKKEEKQKKVRYIIFSVLFLIITFVSASAWMIIDKKIKSLPNWQEMAYWDIRVYDNGKLISEHFDKQWSLLQDTSNIIWPITVKYDLTPFADKETKKWFRIQKFIWDFWDKNIIETLDPEIIHTFETKWNHEVSLIMEVVDLKWDLIEKPVWDIPNINISNVVKITEEPLNNWWKIVELDASSLSNLWKIEWYLTDDLDKPAWKGSTFKLGRPIFEETLIWMYISSASKESDSLDKIFIIWAADDNNISWEIWYNRSILNDLEFDFEVKNIENEFGEWYIKEFLWEIEWKTYTKKWEIDDQEWSSKITHEFSQYWDNTIKVTLTNSNDKTKILTLDLNIPKKVQLQKPLKIYNNWELLEDIEYDTNNNEYFINELPIPTNLKFDARLIRPEGSLYILSKVDWDYNNDWDIDSSWKLLDHTIELDWNHTISVTYTFSHRKIKDKELKLTEKIYIEWVKKDAILSLKIEKENNYAPITVRFDASKSSVKNEDIVKFTWDYGDGITEERWSIVPGHKYTKSGDYTVKLTVQTESWKEYSIEKKLILINKPQSVKISSSLKNAPVYQWIDFSSEWSEWQVLSYFWDFWDGTNSIDANPTHMFTKPWIYTIKLKIDFTNNNVLEDELKIEIYEE